MCVTPHVAQKANSSAIDGRTTRHAGYAVSQRKRKLVEEAFGWGKTIAGLAKVKVRGLPGAVHALIVTDLRVDAKFPAQLFELTKGTGIAKTARLVSAHAEMHVALRTAV